MRVSIALILGALLTGCASPPPVTQVIPPNNPYVYVSGYQIQQRFTGSEVTVGIPALGWLPVIGPYLAEAIRIRAGYSDGVVTPILRETEYAHGRSGSAPRPPAAAQCVHGNHPPARK